MITDEDAFNRLIAEAWNHDFSGWDFDFISERMLQNPTTWDFHQIVSTRIRSVDSLLDLDTGGGEFLSSIGPLPRYTCATEAFPQNVGIAKTRLAPLGVNVYDVSAHGPLPFDDNSFDMIINRHGDVIATEIYRILNIIAEKGKFACTSHRFYIEAMKE